MARGSAKAPKRVKETLGRAAAPSSSRLGLAAATPVPSTVRIADHQDVLLLASVTGKSYCTGYITLLLFYYVP